MAGLSEDEMTTEHRRKIGEANRKRKGIKMKRRLDITPDAVSELWSQGISIRNISKQFSCSCSSIKRRLSDVGITKFRKIRAKKEKIVLPVFKEKVGILLGDHFLMDMF